MEKRLNKRKTLIGIVLSDKMEKTRVVQVSSTRPHSKYPKQVKFHTKFKAHDEKNEAKSGDVVEMMETRRLSKDKRWTITSIVKKNQDKEAAAI
ncbi:MAG: 30S ribosomal protein S17 [Candidatus Omnitrophica bacterium]|nr:30S ribosomal protein S17 [Candidatus Omnitrophota bacterium]